MKTTFGLGRFWMAALLLLAAASPAAAGGLVPIAGRLTDGVGVVGQFDPAQLRPDAAGVTGVMNRYLFSADTGQAATIILTSPRVTYQHLVLTGPAGFRAESDSRTLPTPFRIASGRVPVAGVYACDVCASASGMSDTYELKLTISDTEILLFKASDLGFGDMALPSGAYLDEYQVPVNAGDQVLVSLMSGAFDAYLYVRLPGETAIIENDNREAGTRDSEIVVTVPAAGELTIGASSTALPRRVSQRGGYVLAVERAPGRVPEPEPPAAETGQ